jgi:curli biogenesis system outer membrane secretion channel CsgG
MKTFRMIALLALAALAACADPVTAPATADRAEALKEEGTGFLGGGTRN